MSAIRKLMLSLGLLGLVLPVLTVVGTGTASAGLTTPPNCHDYNTTNNRQLSVCVQSWQSDAGAAQSRGVVTMHSYLLVNGRRAGDVVSKSITINRAFFSPGSAALIAFGQDNGSGTCRVNSPSGSWITCSVPNTARVQYYSTAYPGHASKYVTTATRISFRDDTNTPHTWDVNLSGP